MGRVVHYHHPEAENFSLKYSSASPADLVSRRKELDGATKLIGYPFDTPVYVLYESETEIEAARDMDFDEEWLSDRIAELSHEGQVVAFRLVELLEAAVDVREADEFRSTRNSNRRRSSRRWSTFPGGVHSQRWQAS